MLDLWPFWLPVILGGLLAGACCGLVGVYLVGMRLPFLGVCVSHAALAGAVWAGLLGAGDSMMFLSALAAAALTALALGAIPERLLRLDPNLLMSVLFSLSMGLAFLGLGLYPVWGRSDSQIRNLLWGNLLFCRWPQVLLLAVTLSVMAGFVLLFGKELRAILFSREHARAAAVRVGPVWAAFLVLAALTVTLSFQLVGGLMVYSLLVNPALAAVHWTSGHRRTLFLAAVLGGVCGAGGFLFAALLDWPVGATIVILSSLLCLPSLRRSLRQ